MIKKLDDNLLMLTEEHEEACNVYIIGDICIDTGLFNMGLEECLKEYNVKKAVLTHAHFDHIGRNYLFDEIFTHPIAKNKIENNDVYGHKVKGFDIKKALPKKFNLVKNKEIIKSYKVELEVIYTPGHSLDCISLYEPNKRILFTGDAFYNGLFYFVKDSNIKEAGKSLNKLGKLKPKLICPGHNDICYKIDKSFTGKDNIERIF